MTYVAPNSVQARDIASIVHPQTNLVRASGARADGDRARRRAATCTTTTARGSSMPPRGCGARRWATRRSGWRGSRTSRCASSGYYHLYRGTTNEAGVDLAEKLLQIAPVPMSKVLFQCSGSEANDTAIKLVWYYHAAIGKPEKRKIIGRKMGYHGSTSASISASGKADMHADFGLPFPGFRAHRIPALLPPPP